MLVFCLQRIFSLEITSSFPLVFNIDSLLNLMGKAVSSKDNILIKSELKENCFLNTMYKKI